MGPGDFLNRVEPLSLIESFLEEPPLGFVRAGMEVDGGFLPCFVANFDLSTTLDPFFKKCFSLVCRILPKPRTLFVGTTVTEYAVFPHGVSADVLVRRILGKMGEDCCSLSVIKDLPLNSPLLSTAENAFAADLMAAAERYGFFVVCGEALAYVPIRFSSIDEYLAKFSRARRKDFKKKLRSRGSLCIEEISTGHHAFFSRANLELLYSLYLNVYHDSEIHFDLLTFDFFQRVFTGERGDGVVFVYRKGADIIGFNLCFVDHNTLVDKYIGLQYPMARDLDLYFVSWFYNLEYCIKNRLDTYIAGWTDPRVKGYLGADFTYTYHAVYMRSPWLRTLARRLKPLFEADKRSMTLKK